MDLTDPLVLHGLSLRALLFATGLLLLASGIVKIRGRSRSAASGAGLAYLEVVAAGLLLLRAVTSTPTPGSTTWAVGGAALLFLASSLGQAVRIGLRDRAREGSEARRLVTFVRYGVGSATGRLQEPTFPGGPAPVEKPGPAPAPEPGTAGPTLDPRPGVARGAGGT